MQNHSAIRRFRRARQFVYFTFPAIILVVVFVLLPFVMSVSYSFTKWNGLDKIPKFIGFQNYAALLKDSDMFHTFGFTLEYALVMVILVNVIALLLSLALDSRMVVGKNLYRGAIFLPYIISLIVVGYIWRFIFNQGFDAAYAFTHIAFFKSSWLGNAHLVFFSIVLVSVWQAAGFYVVVYLAGLQTVPPQLIEAATIDGAGSATRFFRVTLPLLMPSVTVCVFYSISNALKTFDVIFSLSGGGPGTASTTAALYIYQTAFIYSRFGYGTAQSVTLFLLIATVTIFQLTVFKNREVEV